MGPGKLKSLGAAILAVLGSAAAGDLLVPDAAARVARRSEEEDSEPTLLLAPALVDAPPLLAHRSHSSHRSHRSHSSGSYHASHRSHTSHSSGHSGSHHASHASHYSGSSYSPSTVYTPPTPKPPPPPKPKPKPGKVSLVAYPGGKIFVDDKPVGTDATGVLTLKAGTHKVRVQNRFLGDHETTVEIADGQTGTVTIEW